jgi:hypothetical protein
MITYLRNFWTYPSSYTILVLWGSAGFGYQPGFATFLVHFLVNPAIMLAAMALAHHEGMKMGRHA